MVMYSMIKALEEDIGKNVRLHFWDDKGDFNMEGKILELIHDKRVLVFEHAPQEAVRMNVTISRINLEGIIMRSIDHLKMTEKERKKRVKENAVALVPCPECGAKIYMVDSTKRPFKDLK